MTTLWIIAGAILGWVVAELPAFITKIKVPISFNIGLAFVGGLTAYTIMTL